MQAFDNLDNFSQEEFLLYDQKDELFQQTPLVKLLYDLAQESSDKSPCDDNVYEIMDHLIQKGCDVNAEDKNKCTCLHYAALIGDQTLITRLLSAGADTNRIDNEGFLPWMKALCFSSKDIADLLLPEGDFYLEVPHYKEPVTSHIGLCILAKQMSCINYLIQRNYDVEAEEIIQRDNTTPLILALERKQSNVVKELLKCGLRKINYKNAAGFSALYYALEAWQHADQIVWTQILDDLIRYGANINALVGHPDTPIIMRQSNLVCLWKLDWILKQKPQLNFV
jgi:ankyrin repeat protein